MEKSELTSSVDALASQCVKCALCLPHCPTYLLTEDENESPRGRIALFQALAQEKLPLSAKVQTHLDQCLGCRACERVCPAHVQYGDLLTQGRTLMNKLPPKDKLHKSSKAVQFLSKIVVHPRLLKVLQTFLWFTQKSGLRQWAQGLGLIRIMGLQSLNQLMPKIEKPIEWNAIYKSSAPKGAVQLFTGCMSNLADQETVKASIYVLNQLGFDVHIPKNQNCCGAMALHAGQRSLAQKLAFENKAAFRNDWPIITLATGCSAVLQEYDHTFSLESNLNFVDIIKFILQIEWPETLSLQALDNLNIMLHTPCTRRNVLKAPNDPALLLSKIPDCKWQVLQSPHCCGAAGAYMIEHPDLAVPLAEKILQECQSQPIDVIATTNIGCALHLRKQLQKTHSPIRLAHPVVLFAKALGF